MAQGAAGAVLAGGPLWASGGKQSRGQWQGAASTQHCGAGRGLMGEVLLPGCPPYLLLGLDPHVLGPLLAMLAFVGAAGLALGCLQPRGPWGHHLHGRHAAPAALQEEEPGQVGGGGSIQEPQALGGVSGARTSSVGPGDPSRLHTPAQGSGPLSEARSKASLRGGRGTR